MLESTGSVPQCHYLTVFTVCGSRNVSSDNVLCWLSFTSQCFFLEGIAFSFSMFEVHIYIEVNLNFSLLGSGLEMLAQISLVF